MKSLRFSSVIFFFSLTIFIQLISGQSLGQDSSRKEEVRSRHFPLKDDEVWPDEVAHLFSLTEEKEVKEEDEKEENGETKDLVEEGVKENEGKREEEKEGNGDFSGKRGKRSIRGEEWTGIWPQRWSESGNATMRHPQPKDDVFVYYYRPEDETYVMSKCTSTMGAAVLTVACPQPRGYPFHRILDVKRVFYGWSNTEGTCQFIEGDCTVPYEFMHKQIMKPSKPVSQEDYFSLGPTFFCNRWDGGGREAWAFDGKMTCSIGARRASAALNPLDSQANPFGKRFGYAWEICGTPYDWFDFIQAEYKCVDVMEPLSGAEEEPEEFFSCEQRSNAMKEERKVKEEKGKDVEEVKEK